MSPSFLGGGSLHVGVPIEFGWERSPTRGERGICNGRLRWEAGAGWQGYMLFFYMLFLLRGAGKREEDAWPELKKNRMLKATNSLLTSNPIFHKVPAAAEAVALSSRPQDQWDGFSSTWGWLPLCLCAHLQSSSTLCSGAAAGTHLASSIYAHKCQFPLSFHKRVVKYISEPCELGQRSYRQAPEKEILMYSKMRTNSKE